MADDATDQGRVSPAARLWLVSVYLYRLTLAPFFGGACRFYPSCSEYSELAVRRHGVLRGLHLTAWRVLRCQPFSAGGLDFP